ncbi:MAG TPA: hypothetical protein VE864_08670, partial [Streptosporangiaceae bacterium]|nr:hypothetical protein [Streptosporangiaceae bacterium]
KAVKKLALAVAVPSMTLGTLAGFAAAPAMASTAQSHGPGVRYERISGFSNGLMNSLPVQVTGGFFDSGTLHSAGPYLALTLGQGSQYMALGSVSALPHVNPATCRVTYHINTSLHIYGGTGQYAGFHGYGSASITETGAVPRVNGHCSSAFNVIPSTAHTTFVASAEVYRY